MRIRLNKFLAQAGVASRREVDKLKRGEGMAYLMLNKPPGYLVTLKDPFKRPTVKELLPSLKERVFHVGRLDYDSEGLLLLTNDGELAHRLAHPRYKIPKTYLVNVKGMPDPSKISRLEKGIVLDGKKTAPARIAKLRDSSKKTLFQVEIYEGRKREVKRMFEAVGHRVLHLKRVGFGGIRLGKLRTGKWRFLTRREVSSLQRKVGLET